MVVQPDLAQRQQLSCTDRQLLSINHGGIIQYTVHCAGMPKYKTEETIMATYAVGYDCVCGRYRVLLSHHRRYHL